MEKLFSISKIAYYNFNPERTKYGIQDNKEYNSATLYRYKAHLLTQVDSTDYSSRAQIGQTILQMAKIYDNMTQGYSVKLKNSETQDTLELPIYNRFSQEYIQQQIENLYSLHWNRPANYFLTLTLSFHQFDTLLQGKQAMMTEWNRLLTWIKKIDKKTQFLGIREIQLQNTKNIHMHILISTKIDYDTLLSMVQTLKIGSQEDLKAMPQYFYEKNGRLPSNHELWYMSIKYLLKYMKKDTEREDPQNSENWAILWALHARVFSKSQSLQPNPDKVNQLDRAFKNNSTSIYLNTLPPNLFFIRASRFNPDFYLKPLIPTWEFLGIGKFAG